MDDLKRLVESRIGPVTDKEIVQEVLPAFQKLVRIIKREGTDNGQRLTNKYFCCLCSEKIFEKRFTKKCEMKP